MKENCMSSTIISVIRYENPTKAVDWLCDVFGFEQHLVYKDDQGKVVHAELKHGSSLIMLGPDTPSEFGKYIKLPKQIGGFVTQCCFVIVANVQAHYERSQQKRTEILLPLKKQDYGASDYTCKDFEGHLWSFGDYNPWKK